MSLFPPTKTPAPLPGSAVLPKEKGRFIFACFTPVSVRFCCAIVVFLVFQLFHPLDERQRVPGQIVPGPPGCHRLQREGAVPERKRVERHRVVQVFQQLAAQEADAVPVGGQRRGCPDVAAFQNFGRTQAAAPQLLQNILALANAVTTNHAGATGDGILMAEAIGADTVDMNQIQLHPTVYQETGMLVSESVRSMGGILVNAEGKRFCNDMSTRDAVSNAELEQPGAYAYIIFDQRIVDDLKSCQKYISNGLTVSSDSYEGLAKEMGLTGDAAANFVETMNTWNASVAAGEDAEFGRSNGMDGDLSTAPYYAIKIAPGIHHTMGGLKINTDAQVLDTDGSIIPGLYAAGETTGGVHGGNRIGGNAVCDFVVFGRIAGSNASAYAAE